MPRLASTPITSAPTTETAPGLKRQVTSILRKYASLDAAGDDRATVRSRENLREKAKSLGLRLVTVNITEEPIPDPAIEALPRKECERIEAISYEMYRQPEAHVAELERLVTRHPHIPMLRNHLAGALNAAGRHDRADQIIADLARLFPKYVFGLCNHVMSLLCRGEIDEARAIVETGPRGPLFVLAHVDPTRDVFHVSEANAHAAMVGHYLLATGRREAAAVQLKMLRKTASDSPQYHSLASAMRRAKALDAMMKRIESLTRERTNRRTRRSPGRRKESSA